MERQCAFLRVVNGSSGDLEQLVDQYRRVDGNDLGVVLTQHDEQLLFEFVVNLPRGRGEGHFYVLVNGVGHAQIVAGAQG